MIPEFKDLTFYMKVDTLTHTKCFKPSFLDFSVKSEQQSCHKNRDHNL